MLFTKPLMDWLHKKSQTIIEAKYFDLITGSIVLINPVVLAFQLIALIKASNVESMSIPLWASFIFIQAAMALVGVKAKNFGMLISMLLSMLISALIIGITLYKQ